MQSVRAASAEWSPPPGLLSLGNAPPPVSLGLTGCQPQFCHGRVCAPSTSVRLPWFAPHTDGKTACICSACTRSSDPTLRPSFLLVSCLLPTNRLLSVYCIFNLWRISHHLASIYHLLPITFIYHLLICHLLTIYFSSTFFSQFVSVHHPSSIYYLYLSSVYLSSTYLALIYCLSSIYFL